jgi:hypothetical protein
MLALCDKALGSVHIPHTVVGRKYQVVCGFLGFSFLCGEANRTLNNQPV